MPDTPSPSSSHILLALPLVTLRTPHETLSGPLSLEHVSSPPSRRHGEAYIVLRVAGLSVPIDPAVPIEVSVDAQGQRVYIVRSNLSLSDDEKSRGEEKKAVTVAGLRDGDVSITVAEYTDDVEMLDSVLAQYGDVSEGDAQSSVRAQAPSPPPSYLWQDSDAPTTVAGADGDGVQGGIIHLDDPALRGRLVLMDQSSGEVVGELPERLSFREDPALLAAGEPSKRHTGAEAGPVVVVELPQDVYDAYTREGGWLDAGGVGEALVETREVFVRAIPPEEQDWVTKGATVVSQVISSSTSLFLSGVNSASSYYIKNSSPYAAPSARPRAKSPTPPHPALTQAHFISDKAAQASAVTASYVEKFIRAAVGGKNTGSPGSSSRSPSRPGTPVNTTYNVYRPKPRLPTQSGSGSASPALLSASPASLSAPNTPPPLPQRKPLRTRDRVLMSANLVLTTVDDSAKRMFEVGSERLGAVIGHKYGPQAQQSTHLATHTVRNVVLVYVDVSGFARRALITTAGKEYMKARMEARHARAEAVEASVSVSGPPPPPSPPPRVRR